MRPTTRSRPIERLTDDSVYCCSEDGIDSAGRVRGEENRIQVIAELRRMQKAFDAALLESEARRAAEVEAGSAGLDEQLQAIASYGSRTQHISTDAIPGLVTPAEAAHVLNKSVSSIRRSIRNGEIRAVRLAENKRGALRIPTSELERLFEASLARGGGT